MSHTSTTLTDAVIREHIDDVKRILSEDKPEQLTIETAILSACASGSTLIVDLLLQHVEDIHHIHDDHDRTPLMLAVGGGYEDVVRILLRYGVPRDAKDDDGRTALDYTMGSPDMISMLNNHVMNEITLDLLPDKAVEVIAPTNIAVIKYWGKLSEKDMIPLNSSISVSLDTDILHTRTVVSTSSCDEMVLNGVQTPIPPRVFRVLQEARRIAGKSNHIRIESKNTFPTAAGLASSASGFAALSLALCRLFEIEDNVAYLARLGSGSAIRSTMGGFVLWDVKSSVRQIAEARHWDDIHVLICIVSSCEKKVTSSNGMKRSVDTSDLLHYRATHLVPDRIARMENAIMEKDWNTFATLTMQDSNQLHAICQDSYPPIRYLSSISHQIIDLVTTLNADAPIAAYTFDAGPNAVIFTLGMHVDHVEAVLKQQVSGIERIVRVKVGCGPMYV